MNVFGQKIKQLREEHGLFQRHLCVALEIDTPMYSKIERGEQRELLENLDVLVDGPFIQKLQDPDLLFRGSSNQRLIDVQKTLYAGEIILWQPNIAVL